jgi:hypothetical protein
MIKNGETLFDAYSRLDALSMKIKGIGCDEYQDGFDVNDETIKSKIFSLIAFDDKQLALNLTLLYAKSKFSQDNLVSYLLLRRIWPRKEQGRRVELCYGFHPYH